MYYIGELLSNRVLIAGLFAWIAAQILKGIIAAIVNRKFQVSRLLGDGGMPSGHSATVTAVAATCALAYGLNSAIFGVSMVLAIITCHDAMHSRNQIGKQAALLNEMFENHDSPPTLEEFVGHTPLQVMAGILLGIIVAITLQLIG